MKHLLSIIFFVIALFSYAQCDHIIRLTDTYGDGWVNASGGPATITVSVNSVPVLVDITLATGYGPQDFTIPVNPGDVINITETFGGGWSGECRVEVLSTVTGTLPGAAAFDPIVAPGSDFTADCGSPITYNSSTTTTASTAGVQDCVTSAEVIGIEVETTGGIGSLNLSQIDLTTTGTTNLAEVTSIDVYYTGNTASFAPTNLFASIAPAGGVSMFGSQDLLTGTNYFWVVYNLINPTTIGNALDGTCTRIVVGGTNYIPTVISPAGNRLITACSPSPGGIENGLQTWFDANTGTIGAPVTQWNNIGPNTNITQLTSPNGGTLSTNDMKANFNNIVTTTGDYDGTFHAEVPTRTQLISGNGVTMYAAYQRQNAPDLVFEFHGSIQTNSGSNGANQWLTWGFRHGGMGALFSNGTGYPYDNAYMATMSQNSGLAGLHGTSNSTGGNTMNGNDMDYANIGAFHGGGNFMELSIGYWPGFGMSRGVMEAILWDEDLSLGDRRKVESYLALKYGITLGVNGTSMDYISSTSGAPIWSSATNAGYNFDIAGISRSDAGSLSQLKSRSTNGPAIGAYNDIVTIVNGSNFASPAAITADNSHFIWGHNGGSINNTGALVNYTTDNGEVIETIFSRRWKSQETGTIGTVTLEFDMNNVVGVGAALGTNDLANLRLLVDEDGDFTNGATSISPLSFNNTTNIAYFQVDFVPFMTNHMVQNRGYYFTLASTNFDATPLPITIESISVVEADCSNAIKWSTLTEVNTEKFTIYRSYDMLNWTKLTDMLAAGNSNSKLEYLYRDADFDENGTIYYKLDQHDLNGNITSLGVLGVDGFCSSNVEPMIYPNPVVNDLMIKSVNEGEVMVTDIQGKLVFSEALSSGLSIFDVSNIESGIYVVKIIENSGKSFKKKFIKL